MSKVNSNRTGCVDVFNAFMLDNAFLTEENELPILKPTFEVPNKLISFSKATRTNDYDQWVHFYEDDTLFERLWRQPRKYLPLLKKFRGVILPDFSVYRDFPIRMQTWNILRSRMVGNWLQNDSVSIIPNIRYGDERTYDMACEGVSKNCVIAIGTHGNIKVSEDRKHLLKGLDRVVELLEPSDIVLYGAAPKEHFSKYEERGIALHRFDSDIATHFRKEVR